MDFKTRFKEKISHVSKEGVVGIIAQSSQPITKFKVSNTNLHYKIFSQKNPSNENNIQLDFSPAVFTKSKATNFLNGPISSKALFKEKSSEDLQSRQNYQVSKFKNVRSANESPITSLSPLYKEIPGVSKLPFFPAIIKNDLNINKKTRFSEESKIESAVNTPLITTPLMKKNDDGYAIKWTKIKENRKQSPPAFVNTAEKNVLANSNSSYVSNEFIQKAYQKTKNLKDLGAEIGKVLDKLNEISDNLKGNYNYC